MLTVDQVANMAEGACFYVTPDGLWLRMLYCEMNEGYFQALDEESYEEYRIEFEDVAQEEEKPHFEKLIRMKVPKLPKK